jgi:hypothetical protein
MNALDKKRVATKYKKVRLGPGSHEMEDAKQCTMRKKSINILPLKEKREVYYTSSLNNLKSLPAPNKYQKEGFVKSMNALSKSPPSIRTRRH